MFKTIGISAAKLVASTATRLSAKHVAIPISSIRNISSALTQNVLFYKPLLNSKIVPQTNKEPVRTVTKFSWRKGKRKSVKVVLQKFYRLHWGGWIRTKCGRAKKLWKKTSQRKRRLRMHVFCNSTQSTLLDKMVGKYWQKPKYYIDDPYEPYHTREEWKFTYKKPKPYIPPEERS